MSELLEENKVTEKTSVEMWAIVEIFGHQRIAGRLSEQVIAGAGFVRIDVPEVPAAASRYGEQRRSIQAHTKLYGPGAIYAISAVDEAIATAAAAQIRHEPVDSYTLAEIFKNMPEDQRTRLLRGPDERHDDDDGGTSDDDPLELR